LNENKTQKDFVVGISMKKAFIPFFIVLGALDFLYGVIFGDRISMIVGAAIVAITLYVLKTKNKD
jgi:hypothetical protein